MREAVVNEVIEVTNPQIYYEQSRVMVQIGDNRMNYDDISKRIEYEITKGPQ